MSFFSNLFSCCSAAQSSEKYMVKTKDGQTMMVNSKDELDKNFAENQNIQITQVKTLQGFQTRKQQLRNDNANFMDVLFPHNNTSIGKQYGSTVQWKRIPELIPAGVTPTIFDNKIQPSDVITGHEGDCYFLSSLAALAESPDTIRQIFKNQSYNKQGMYYLYLRNNGVIEQVLVDDYIPVGENGTPLYCQPNPKTGQFWVVLIQKAIAKVKGSYQQLQVGTPSDIFRIVGHAPAESIVFTNKQEQKDRIWNILFQNSNKKNPTCATTVNKVTSGNNLQNSHTYTVLNAVEFHNEHHSQRIVKIRNPWKQVNYHGKASNSDNKFWDNIHAQKKGDFLAYNNNSGYGIATLHFDDFMANFNQLHLSNVNGGGKYFLERVAYNDKKGKYFDLQVNREGTYTFELNQSKVDNKKPKTNFQNQPPAPNPHASKPVNQPVQIHLQQVVQKLQILNQLKQKEPGEIEYKLNHTPVNITNQIHLQQSDPNEQRFGRSTIIIFSKDKVSNNYQFVNGNMKYNEQNTTLTQRLSPGSYIIYTKIDHISKSGRAPQNSNLGIYSTNYATLTPSTPSSHLNIFNKAFMNHAQHNKKIEQLQGKVWISYQLLFQKGGYAYLAVGNQADSNHAVIVHFNPADFDNLNFYLKQPYKSLAETVMRVMPGHKQIIVAKVKNDSSVTSVKFPPKLDIKLETLFNNPA